jgi:hypothetical protein
LAKPVGPRRNQAHPLHQLKKRSSIICSELQQLKPLNSIDGTAPSAAEATKRAGESLRWLFSDLATSLLSESVSACRPAFRTNLAAAMLALPTRSAGRFSPHGPSGVGLLLLGALDAQSLADNLPPGISLDACALFVGLRETPLGLGDYRFRDQGPDEP